LLPGLSGDPRRALALPYPAACPLAARVGTAAGTAHGAAYDPEHAYEFGLQVILDGLAAQLPGPGAVTSREVLSDKL
jgi:hypothetical protein